MAKLISIVAFVILIFCQGFAMAQVVTGKVTDEMGVALPGVNIQIKGTTTGTITDVDGNYAVDMKGNSQLVFSYIGYVTQQVDINGRGVVDVEMVEEANQLQEVVVVGYGTIRKSDLTGAVSSVKNEDLIKVPLSDPIQSLQGKIAGVMVSAPSGAPGAQGVVRVRGIGTFNNSSPIYVVDGVITEDISFLNSADIKSIEVLKDASATAIYGNRGANGVIMVTTFSGAAVEGSKVQVSSYYGVQNLQKKIDLLSGREFATVVNEISPGTYNNLDALPDTDWQDLIFEQAPIQSHMISFAGSKEKNSFYYSASYYNQEGIIPKSSYQRFTIRFNNTYNPVENFTLGSNITITPYNQQNTAGNAPFVAYRASPIIKPFLPDGGYSAVPGTGNVLADINYTNSFNRGVRGVGNIYGEYRFLDDLSFKSSFGVDLNFNKHENFRPAYFVSPQQNNDVNDLVKEHFERFSWLWENTVNWNRTIDVHDFNVVVGYTMQRVTTERLNVASEGLLRDDEDFWYVDRGLGEIISVENDVNLNDYYSMISFLGRINYVYDDRYLFTATFRRDGSSKFIGSNRYGSFPSLAVGWNVINEGFIAEASALSNLKLRASWGIIGNEKIRYDAIYSTIANGIDAVFGIPGQLYPGNTYGEIGNPTLRWENTEQFDAGLEIGFWNDKFFAELDYYRKRTYDVLIPLDVPGYFGNGSARIIYNAAEILNSGVELNLVYNTSWKDIDFSFNANGSTIHNEVLSVSGSGGEDDVLYGIFGSQTVTRTVPGMPVGTFYGYEVDGIFQNPGELDAYPHLSTAGVGDLRFVDVDNNGVLNGEDRTNLGSPIPKHVYGFGVQASYKSLSVSMDFQGLGGNKIFNLKETVRPDLYNFEQHVIDYWNGEGSSTTEPRPSAGGYNFLPSSRFIQDGGFFRLRSVTIGYSLAKPLVSKVGLGEVDLFLRGTNLFTITEFTGYSPEVLSGNPILNGIDEGTYPTTAIYTLGLNISF